MDGAVDAAAAEQRGVGGIDDGIDVERRDVGDADLEPRRSDLGGEQRRDAHTGHCSMRGEGGLISGVYGFPGASGMDCAEGKRRPEDRRQADGRKITEDCRRRADADCDFPKVENGVRGEPRRTAATAQFGRCLVWVSTLARPRDPALKNAHRSLISC